MSKMFKSLGILLVISSLALSLVGCAKPLTLTVTEPTDRATVTEPLVTVKGYVSDARAIVAVNDVEVSVTNEGYFDTEVALTEGENSIDVVATRGKSVATKTVTVTYAPLPALSLEITSPEDGATVTASIVSVSGTVSDPEATVRVSDVEVEVVEDGTFSADVELTEGENVITVVATLGEETQTKTVTVTYTPSE
jgi:nitrogen fixation protein FixH